MTTINPPAEPPGEPTAQEIARALDALEQHVADHAPEPEPPAGPLVPLEGGETKRVRALRAEVAEAHHLAELQRDETPLFLDTKRVRKHQRRAAEAARLHELAQDPMTRAYRVLRTRRRLIAVAMVALTLALAWSTAGVQAFAAEGAAKWTPPWVFAWFVEPFMSLALLVVVGARAYLSTLGQPIESKTLTRIERLFLGLTLGMNAWPYLPWVADKFSFSSLVLHVLGPIVAVAIVVALPIILAAFTRLDLGLSSRGATGRKYRGNTLSESGVESGATGLDDIDIKAARIRKMINAGELPEEPGVEKIRTTLRCATATARAVRDRLAEGGGWNSGIDEEYR
jgi:hypothetical protein